MAELADRLRGSARVGLDTSIFIYHIEGSSRYAEPAGIALDGLAAALFTGVTSILTLMELVVRPLQLGQREIANDYEALVRTYPNLTIVNLNPAIARRAAELRARYRLRAADALQVGACLEHGARAFLTNDRDLRRVVELDVLLLDDWVTAPGG